MTEQMKENKVAGMMLSLVQKVAVNWLERWYVAFLAIDCRGLREERTRRG